MIHSGAIGFALLLAATPASANSIAPIDQTDALRDAGFTRDRCDDFAKAVTIYATILGANPVDGKDPDRKAPFLWAQNVTATTSQHRGTFPEVRENAVQAYLDAFGPVQHPSLLPNQPLYQSDMATCLKEFGSPK